MLLSQRTEKDDCHQLLTTATSRPRTTRGILGLRNSYRRGGQGAGGGCPPATNCKAGKKPLNTFFTQGCFQQRLRAIASRGHLLALRQPNQDPGQFHAGVGIRLCLHGDVPDGVRIFFKKI